MAAKRGRPEYAPTKAQRDRVAIAAGGGMAHEEIALGLGISRTTLLKHFRLELSVGAYEKRLEVLQAMFKSAKGGNVAAQKAYVGLTPALSAPPAEAEQAEKTPAKGKKEQAKEDAVTAQVGTEWGDLLPGAGRILQ